MAKTEAERPLGAWAWCRAAILTVVIVIVCFEDVQPTGPLRDVKDGVYAPIKALVLEPLELRQRWRLFARPSRHPRRYEVAVRRGPGAPWDVVYRQQDAEHDFASWRLDSRRLRYYLSPPSTGGRDYRNASRWIASLVLAEIPDAVAVRIRQERMRIERPNVHGPSSYQLEMRFTRPDVEAMTARWRARRGSDR